LTPTKVAVTAEVQVRTIFEEAWSEIDHKIRYPHNKGDPVLNQFLAVFNQLAGSADGMGSFIRSLNSELAARRESHAKEVRSNENEIAALKAQIEQLTIDTPQKEQLRSGLDALLAKSGSFTISPDSLIGLPAIEELQRPSIMSQWPSLAEALGRKAAEKALGLEPQPLSAAQKQLLDPAPAPGESKDSKKKGK
jgi:hypothetical protein